MRQPKALFCGLAAASLLLSSAAQALEKTPSPPASTPAPTPAPQATPPQPSPPQSTAPQSTAPPASTPPSTPVKEEPPEKPEISSLQLTFSALPGLLATFEDGAPHVNHGYGSAAVGLSVAQRFGVGVYMGRLLFFDANEGAVEGGVEASFHFFDFFQARVRGGRVSTDPRPGGEFEGGLSGHILTMVRLIPWPSKCVRSHANEARVSLEVVAGASSWNFISTHRAAGLKPSDRDSITGALVGFNFAFNYGLLLR